ncbi:MAG: sialate O-acetylesterase [Phycisphaerales bacterium]
MITSRARFRFSLLAATTLLAGIAGADIALPGVFSDHMVLQRGCEMTVWGQADPSETVRVTLGESVATTVAAPDGSWQVHLPAADAGGPLLLTVAGKNELQFEDVMIGDVWVCSGQSNMEWPVSASQHAAEVIAAAGEHPNIRLLHMPRSVAGQPLQDVPATWARCSAESVRGFSAVGLAFGMAVAEKENVAIGLIESAWGGTRIEPWTARAGFADVPSLQTIAEEIAQANATFAEQVQQDAAAEHPLASHTAPTGLYNAMIAPLTHFAIAGVIWYQGESNVGDGALYTDKMRALISSWRGAWHRDDLPFLWVQLAPFNYGQSREGQLPLLWEAQQKALAISSTGMAVINDISNVSDIHPRNKQEVGRRLALIALAQVYGHDDVMWSGPVFKRMTIQDSRATLTFDHVHGGLQSRDGEAISHFEIAGEDQVFVSAQSRIENDSIIVWNDAIAHPVAVRFAWSQTAEPNLVNGAGLPAGAFRTDTWE